MVSMLRTPVQHLTVFFLLCYTTFASVRYLSVPKSFETGKPFTITWEGDGPDQYILVLRKGPSTNLATVETLTTVPYSTKAFIWTPSKNLHEGSDYALEIKQGTEDNFYGPFSITGGSGGGTTPPTSTTRTKPTATKTSTSPVKETTSYDLPNSTSSASSTSKSSLSSGDKAAIGVGAVLGVIIILALGCWFAHIIQTSKAKSAESETSSC